VIAESDIKQMRASNLAKVPRIVAERDLDMNKRTVKLAPSILAADFACLGEQVTRRSKPELTVSTLT